MAGDSKWRRRQILKTTGAGLAAGGLAGCTGDGDGDGGDGSKTTISFIDRVQSSADAYPAAFNESQDEVQVDGRKVGDRYEDVITQIRAGEQPGDVIGLDVVQLELFNDLGALADIGSFADDLEVRDDILGGLDPLFFEASDTTVALPFWIDASFYYYNKNHFEEAGLDPESPPETWTEFEEAAAALDELNDEFPPIGMSFNGGLAEFLFWPFIWSNGGQIINDAGDEAMIDRDPAIEALEFWVNLSDQGYTTDLIASEWPDFHSQFAGGDTSIMASSQYGIGYIQENNQEMYENENFGTALFPAPEGKERSSFLGGNSISIISDAKDDEATFEAAKEFLRWTLSEEGMETTQSNGDLPPRSRGFEIGSFAEEPYSTYIEQAEVALDQGKVLIHPNYEGIAQEMRPAVEAAIAGNKSAKQAFTDAANRINNDVLGE
ncbi:MAG: extracellular solute-binding protein [Natronomonas sp.]|uniref:extracellular solute-binding protein n=1 Tax=Natronomonas sp. TaxID=2184060 RepID=UPI0028708969|nr:extracellular solute-binding protein [Natronomonas sp.]MDR9431543.1 extracellular solute-binding protein [Natronomonas sp.]